jgi:hypothetical protein
MATHMPSRDLLISIRVRPSTKALRGALKVNRQTYEELILELAEERFPAPLINRLKRRFSLPHGPTAAEAFRRAGIWYIRSVSRGHSNGACKSQRSDRASGRT